MACTGLMVERVLPARQDIASAFASTSQLAAKLINTSWRQLRSRSGPALV